MELLASRRLLAKAHWLFLPIPDHWEQTSDTGERYLTREGMTALRAAIAQERRLRRERALAWVAPLTGLVGALTGLASILSHCRRSVP